MVLTRAALIDILIEQLFLSFKVKKDFKKVVDEIRQFII